MARIVAEDPTCPRRRHVVAAGIVRRPSASADPKALVDVGALEEVRAGREKLFIDPALLKAPAGAERRRAARGRYALAVRSSASGVRGPVPPFPPPPPPPMVPGPSHATTGTDDR